MITFQSGIVFFVVVIICKSSSEDGICYKSLPSERPKDAWSKTTINSYPNPMKDPNKCRLTQPSRICNEPNLFNCTLNQEAVNNLVIETLKIEGNDSACLCNKNCYKTGIGIQFSLAAMNRIGPNIDDVDAGIKEFIPDLSKVLGLGNCSVLFVVSKKDNTFHVEFGRDVQLLIGDNWESVTKLHIKNLNETYFSKQLYLEGLNHALTLYRNATEEYVKKTDEERAAESQNLVWIIAPILIVIIVIVIVVAVIYVMKLKTKNKRAGVNEYVRASEAGVPLKTPANV